MAYGRTARSCLGWVALATVVACAGCGSDANLDVSSQQKCTGGGGPAIRGTVRMPNGRLAARDGGLLDRLAALAVAPVDALTGNVSPVGKGVTVELVQLRPEDIGGDTDPGAVARTTTNGNGEFCVNLVRDTTVDVCRYMVRVGSRDNGTRTRAFVYSSDEAIDIDYASEATVNVILNGIPPADLCDFATDEIASIHDAVRAVPGNVGGGSAAEVNALATTMAINDATVRALVAEAGNLPPPTATSVPGAPTNTATTVPSSTPVVPTATHTHTGPTSTRTFRPTRTPNGPTVTSTPSRTAVPSRTNTPGGATVTATAPATATSTGAATATVPGATATATRPAATATATIAGPTPTFTATPMPAAGLGERVFTIREDSQSASPNPRTGFFSSGLAGFSVSDLFTSGPVVLVADAPNANGVAQLRLKQDAYFKVNVKLGNTTLCMRLTAAGSHGSIDCNGGTAYGVTLTEPAGDTPMGVPVTGVGNDSGAGAANLFTRLTITEVGNSCPDGGGHCSITGEACTFAADCVNDFATTKPCDATTVFPDPSFDVVFTTANFTAMKGSARLSKDGENFSCTTWTMTDDVGMLVTGLVSTDPRAGGNSANGLRLADK